MIRTRLTRTAGAISTTALAALALTACTPADSAGCTPGADSPEQAMADFLAAVDTQDTDAVTAVLHPRLTFSENDLAALSETLGPASESAVIVRDGEGYGTFKATVEDADGAELHVFDVFELEDADDDPNTYSGCYGVVWGDVEPLGPNASVTPSTAVTRPSPSS